MTLERPVVSSGALFYEYFSWPLGAGDRLLRSAKSKADYIADAWAHDDDKVQLQAIQIAFKVCTFGSRRSLVYHLRPSAHPYLATFLTY